MDPIVSVVIPTYNREAQFLRCLESVTRQNYPKNDYEIIAVHDGKHCDYDAKRIKEILAAVPGSQFLTVSHRGVSGVRNKGISKSRGRLVLCIDDDCIADPNWIISFVKYMSGSPKTIAAGGQVIAAKPQSYVQKYIAFKELLARPVRDRYGQITTLITANVCFRRQVLLSVGGFNQKIPYAGGEDLDISIRLRSLGALGYCESARVQHEHRSTLRGLILQHIAYGRGTYLACRNNSIDYLDLKFYKPTIWGFGRYTVYVVKRIFVVSLPEFYRKQLVWYNWLPYVVLDVLRKMSFNIGATLEYYQSKTS